jgi:thymidylate kinase
MGILISFSGIDGAGKSTQVAYVERYLKRNNKKFLTTESMFTYVLLKPLVKILRKKTNSPQGGPVILNKTWYAKLWFVPAFIDIWIGYLFGIRQKLTKYEVIVADRFYIDIWANLLYYGYIPAWAYYFFIKFLPKADESILFLVSPETVRKREEDFPLSYYTDQSKIYKNLTSLVRVHTIDANRSPKVVFAEIKRILDTRLYA